MAQYAGAAQSSASGEFVSASGDYGELLSKVGSLCVFSVASLERCCRVKPDPVYYGYVALSEKAFKGYPYDGSNATYLKSLFDKHNSEAIVVHRKTVAGEFRVPLSAGCAFNYQLYVGAAMPTDEDEKNDLLRLAKNFHIASASGETPLSRKLFQALAKHDNSILKKPQPAADFLFASDEDEDEDEEVDDILVENQEISFHTLPSLVFECCGHASLHDIYTWYCRQDILVSNKPFRGVAGAQASKRWREKQRAFKGEQGKGEQQWGYRSYVSNDRQPAAQQGSWSYDGYRSYVSNDRQPSAQQGSWSYDRQPAAQKGSNPAKGKGYQQ